MNADDHRYATVMVVDDKPTNLNLLEVVLGSAGYRVRSFPAGRLALTSAAQDPPDLILLDISMPEMDGIEVCSRLKADPALAAIPVIFITGLADIADKMRAFNAGGVDFVTKPIQAEEVLARVNTHLKLRHLQRELEQHNSRLDRTVQIKTRELRDAHGRLAALDKAKGDFLKLISHELRTPLNGLFGVADLLFSELPRNREEAEFRELFGRSRNRILTVIEDALLLTEIEVTPDSHHAGSVDLYLALSQAIVNATSLAQRLGVGLGGMPESLGEVRGEAPLLERALTALVETAVKFAEPGVETVRFAVQPSGAEVELWIEAVGRAIPAGALPRFFGVLAISESMTPGGDLGLEPAVAARILRLFGGTVAVENREPPGIRLTVRLPAVGEALSEP